MGGLGGYGWMMDDRIIALHTFFFLVYAGPAGGFVLFTGAAACRYS